MTTEPSLEEIDEWFQREEEKLDGEDRQILDYLFTRANKYGLAAAIVTHAYENKDEPGFNLIEYLEEALYRWDV